LKCPKLRTTKFVAGGRRAGPARITAPEATGQKDERDSRYDEKQYGSLDSPGDCDGPAGDLARHVRPVDERDARNPSKTKAEGATGTRQTADAAILQGRAIVEPRARRGQRRAPGARRCPTAGGVVPVGRRSDRPAGSTGKRASSRNEDEFITATTSRSQGMPIPTPSSGGISFAGRLAIAVRRG